MLEIQRVKDPEQPGEILIRARWLDDDGNVVKVLGTMTLDEDEFTAQANEATTAAIAAWANDLVVAKGFATP